VDKEILQRIILVFWILTGLSLFAEAFQHFVSLSVIDTFTGRHENILLEPGKISRDEKQLFEIKTESIEKDEENPHVAWVNLEIRYTGSKADVPLCVQRGKLCTNQIYRFNTGRYIIAFDVLAQLNED
jgi:hypothetical protein